MFEISLNREATIVYMYTSSEREGGRETCREPKQQATVHEYKSTVYKIMPAAVSQNVM